MFLPDTPKSISIVSGQTSIFLEMYTNGQALMMHAYNRRYNQTSLFCDGDGALAFGPVRVFYHDHTICTMNLES